MKKICSKCRQEKDIEEFCFKKYFKDGRNTQCKFCCNKYNRAKRQQFLENFNNGYVISKPTKICNICKEEKDIVDFYTSKYSKDGKEYRCKKCLNEYQKKQSIYCEMPCEELIKTCNVCKQVKNIEEFYPRKNRKTGRIGTCKDCYAIKRSSRWHSDYVYRNKLSRCGKQYNLTHKKEKLNYNKKYSQSHKKERNQRLFDRLKNDIEFRLLCRLRNQVKQAVINQHTEKSHKTKELIGCTIKFLREHLESKFLEGMSWDNYGRKGWHIDHIKPCAAFDLTKEEEQKKCFYYTNLQPLWAKDNIQKSSMYQGQIIRKKRQNS